MGAAWGRAAGPAPPQRAPRGSHALLGGLPRAGQPFEGTGAVPVAPEVPVVLV
jgi:hypothetical protein